MIKMDDIQCGYDTWAAKPHNAKWVRKIDGTPIANDIVATIFNTLREGDADWRADPSRDERWSAGLDYGMTQLCAFLSVDPQSVMWDAATETLGGDVQSVLGNILRKHFGDDWGPTPSPAPIKGAAE